MREKMIENQHSKIQLRDTGRLKMVSLLTTIILNASLG